MMGRLQRKKKTTKARKRKNSGENLAGNVRSKDKSNSRISSKSDVSGSRSSFGTKIIKVVSFFKESKLEIARVVWPSKKQTVGSSFLVVAIAGLISFFLGIIDAGLSNVLKVVLR